MQEYVIRVRQVGDGYAATLRQLATSSSAEAMPILGTEAVGVGANAMAAMVSAIANARVRDFQEPRRRPYAV